MPTYEIRATVVRGLRTGDQISFTMEVDDLSEAYKESVKKASEVLCYPQNCLKVMVREAKRSPNVY